MCLWEWLVPLQAGPGWCGYLSLSPPVRLVPVRAGPGRCRNLDCYRPPPISSSSSMIPGPHCHAPLHSSSFVHGTSSLLVLVLPPLSFDTTPKRQYLHGSTPVTIPLMKYLRPGPVPVIWYTRNAAGTGSALLVRRR
jgi:hypothetical protein